MGPRITIIGGGSTHWTPKLLVDFANTPSLHDADVVLMDLEQSSLPPMVELSGQIARRRGIGLSTRSTTDLDESLDGAEFVVTAFSVGGFESMRYDLEIPAQYGVRPPVGDSVGPGGVSRALRSIPVLLGIARRMERRCPEALLLNVTNPLTALCRSVTRETSIRTVGLCNEVVGQEFVLSLLLDADMRTIDPVVAGVNHFPLVTELRIGGNDGFEMLRGVLDHPEGLVAEPLWMTPPSAMHWRKVSSGKDWTKADVLANTRVKTELFRRLGVLPFASDTHIVEFMPGFVTAASDFGRDWGVHHYGIHGHMADKDEDHASLAELRASEEVPPWASGELVAPVIDGILGAETRPLPVNLPNTGQVESLPADVVVECIGLIGPDGVRPRDQVRVPSALGEELRRVCASQELTVDAAVTGRRTTVLEAMITDPLAGCLPYEKLVAMTDELLAATAAWLPQFTA